MRPVIYCSLLLGLAASFSAKPVEICDGKPTDIVFVLDSSNSIWSPDFHKELKFVENVVDQLTIGFGPDETRVGVLMFSYNAHVQFYLNKYGNKEMLKRAISEVRRTQGQTTNTADAIHMARTEMFTEENGARPDVKHIAILITDGKSSDPIATVREATSARDAGIHIMAIGVGRNVDNIELNSIVTLPASQFVFRVTDYIGLTSIISKLAEQACKVSNDVTTRPQPTKSATQPIVTTALPGGNNGPETTSIRSLSSTTAEMDLESTLSNTTVRSFRHAEIMAGFFLDSDWSVATRLWQRGHTHYSADQSELRKKPTMISVCRNERTVALDFESHDKDEATPNSETKTIGPKTSPLWPVEIPTLRPGRVV